MDTDPNGRREPQPQRAQMANRLNYLLFCPLATILEAVFGVNANRL